MTGTIRSGAGKGALFMQLEWVVRQCKLKLGFAPYPGTLNIDVRDEDLPGLERLTRSAALCLDPDDAASCSARMQPVSIHGIPAAVVLPSEDVRIHAARVVELIAPCNLKRALGLGDGDAVRIEPPPAYPGSSALYREIYEFAASAGALEGFLYERGNVAASDLDNWVRNLGAQYRALPAQARQALQPALDRTVGRAVHSLIALIGDSHPHVERLRDLVQGDPPSSAGDFEGEKAEKAARFGNRRNERA